MKAQRRLGLDLSWPRITLVLLIDVAVLVLATNLPVPASQKVAWWVGVAVAAVVTIAAVITYRGITVASGLASWLWGWSAPETLESSPDSEAILSPGCTPAIDHRRRFGRDVVGVREYQGHLVAVIAVEENADALSGRHQHEIVSPATLPVTVVAGGLRQFDVRLDAIDIVSVRKRHVSEAANPSAAPIVDDRPAGTEWYVAGVTDGSAAQCRGGGGPRFGGLDLGGGHRAARP
jgi:type VII secretion protein EccE